MHFILKESNRLVVPKIDTLVQILWTPKVFITEKEYTKEYVTAESLFGAVTYSPIIRHNPNFESALSQDGQFITKELEKEFDKANRESLIGAFKVHDA